MRHQQMVVSRSGVAEKKNFSDLFGRTSPARQKAVRSDVLDMPFTYDWFDTRTEVARRQEESAALNRSAQLGCRSPRDDFRSPRVNFQSPRDSCRSPRDTCTEATSAKNSVRQNFQKGSPRDNFRSPRENGKLPDTDRSELVTDRSEPKSELITDRSEPSTARSLGDDVRTPWRYPPEKSPRPEQLSPRDGIQRQLSDARVRKLAEGKSQVFGFEPARPSCPGERFSVLVDCRGGSRYAMGTTQNASVAPVQKEAYPSPRVRFDSSGYYVTRRSRLIQCNVDRSSSRDTCFSMARDKKARDFSSDRTALFGDW